MVETNIRYEGSLRCTAEHAPSHTTLTTDAPVDNQGKGESFSPTDLVATALGSCILTTMGIVAARMQVDMTGSHATVIKEMATSAPRRIAKLAVTLTMHGTFDETQKEKLTRAAHVCPVHQSLHLDIDVPIDIHWP
ncbi:MAG: OsmC family protein [Alphaproteobacteria bacterium]|nr:OsmC family protein [Alphaproteobacteria bacterium]MBV8549183.1 OsmC family protein [Alphaproteobacteria bacterium]